MNKELESNIKEASNSSKAKILQRFFKTGKGEYGDGDVFLGITVPEQRKIVKEFKTLNIQDIQELLDSTIHEKRLIGLLILIEQYKIARKENNEKIRKEFFEFYLKNAKESKINNWDLVDLSAPNIVGDYLLNKEPDVLYRLSKSDNLWEKRIAIISTFAFIRNNEFNHTLKISEFLLSDPHDLIHKAVGWMLREIGKRNINVLEDFLIKNYREPEGFSFQSNVKDKSNISLYKKMPRTMLRYAIEKFPEEKRSMYLKGEV